MLYTLWQELTRGLHSSDEAFRVVIRLVAAMILGGIVGVQRESTRKPAGLRTHVLVSVATAAFIIACSASGMSSDGLSRVIQGIVTGIGFIGAGSILKLDKERNIQGLTTSGGIWIAAGIGVAVGLGVLGLALLATFLTFIILTFVGSLDSRNGSTGTAAENS